MSRLMGTSPSTSHRYSAPFAASQRDVNYSCGSCGYDLKLSSSSRNMSTIGTKYGKFIKKGVIPFSSIDESRFSLVEKYTWLPCFVFKRYGGLFSRRAKLLCRKCGNHIGDARDDTFASPCFLITNGKVSPSSNEVSTRKKYDIRIRSLQPS